MIEEIAQHRVKQTNALIDAYHRKSEVALNMTPPPIAQQSGEKLYEIQEKLESYDSIKIKGLEALQGSPRNQSAVEEAKQIPIDSFGTPKLGGRAQTMEVDTSYDMPIDKRFATKNTGGGQLQGSDPGFQEDNPYQRPFKIEARDIILRNFLLED